jgi:hypothetical protein
MQKHTLLFMLLLAAAAAHAQSSAKRYVLIEHFTNSKCSVCASKNPAFHTLIDQYHNDIHHVSIHPSIPYNSCAFYLANPSENNARASAYNIDGTPRVALNGTLIPAGAQLLPPATLQTYLNQTSPVWIQVSETGPANARVATVKVHSLDQAPAGNFKLYAAVVEKEVDAPPPPNNGEQLHHNVFRDMLTDINGADFTLAADGQSVDYTFTYAVNPAWNAEEIYLVAWVQNPVTKEVLNSGTRFDPVLTATNEAAPQTIQIQPNPVNDIAFARIGEDEAKQVEIFATNGQRISVTFENQGIGTVGIPTATLAPGLYFVKITGENGVYVAKMVKI